MRKPIILILLVSAFNFHTLSQENCKVLVTEIAEKYEGKCKNGLAHGKGLATGKDTYKGRFVKGLPDGKGTYTWATGDVYKGMWRAGKRNGEGVYTIKFAEKDSVIAGIWVNDKYKGPKPKPPRVIYKNNVTRYKFTKIDDLNNQVEIRVTKSGMTNANLIDYNVTMSSGRIVGQIIENVSFPLKVKVTYSTSSSLSGTEFFVSFEFEIFDPGSWLVVLSNQ